jgi:dTDP-glucose 4,6-dehydratase
MAKEELMNILVTGGAGFIGSNFIRYMLAKYHNCRITNLDKLTYCGNPDNLKDISKNRNYKFIKADICNTKAVLSAMKNCDYVINFAAESHVDRSIKNSAEFIKTNIEGTRVLLDTAVKLKIKRFIQISTDEVYGDIKRGLSKETDNLLPNSPYAASKAAADILCRAYFKTHNLPVLITRSSNNFGPYQYPEKVIPLFLTNAIENKSLPLYGNGMNVRDWVYVIDNCSGIDCAIKKGKPGEIYNIGGGNKITNIDIAKQILVIMGKDKKLLSFVKDRPGHDKRYALDSSKIKKLGWQPRYKFKTALELTVKWYMDNRSWWQPLKRCARIIKW